MVQLEHRMSIRPMKAAAMFQFHKGSIRTVCRRYQILGVRCFNSIKVQLEREPKLQIQERKCVSIP